MSQGILTEMKGSIQLTSLFKKVCWPLLLAMVKEPKTEVHTDNGLPLSVLSGRVSHSSSGDRRVPWLRKSLVWIWQHDKRTDDYNIILNLRKKIDEK